MARRMPTRLTAAQVPDLLKPGMTVFLAGSATEPTSLFTALKARPEASRGVRYTGVLVPGVNRDSPADWHADARMTAFFITPDMSRSFQAGRTELIPLQYHENYAFLRHRFPIDLALVSLSPPDAAGNCSRGICNDFL